jgi:hypothetical protein
MGQCRQHGISCGTQHMQQMLASALLPQQQQRMCRYLVRT